MILHIDMDAFYAFVKQLDNPWLREKCVVVEGVSNRGVVSASIYEAPKFGVRSAIPIFQPKQKCPEGIFIPPVYRCSWIYLNGPKKMITSGKRLIAPWKPSPKSSGGMPAGEQP